MGAQDDKICRLDGRTPALSRICDHHQVQSVLDTTRSLPRCDGQRCRTHDGSSLEVLLLLLELLEEELELDSEELSLGPAAGQATTLDGVPVARLLRPTPFRELRHRP